MTSERRSRTDEVTERLAELRRRGETLPGARFALQALHSERQAGGGLLAGGVAFRVFLWLVPFGLVLAVVLSGWNEYDPEGLETAARELGVGAAAAQGASEALQSGSQSLLLLGLLGLVALAWFTLGAIRAFVLAYALAWHVAPSRVRRPLRAIALFNGLFVLAMATSAAAAWLREQIGATALLGVILTFATTAAVALGAMWLLPHRATHPRELLPGAVLFAGGNQAVQVAVLFYFAPMLGERQETYGAFGAAATMLVWLYVLSRLATGAAFLNATIWRHHHPGAPDVVAGA